MMNLTSWMLRMVVVAIAVLGFIGNGFAESPREQTKNTSEQQQKNPAITSNAAKPTIPPSSKAPPITEAQLRKVLNNLVQTGTEGSIRPIIAKALGLSKNGLKVWARQLAVEDEIPIQYGFAQLKNGSGYMLDKGPRNGDRIYFRLYSNLKIVTAVAMDSANEFTTLSPADAEAQLREVLAVWAEYADAL